MTTASPNIDHFQDEFRSHREEHVYPDHLDPDSDGAAAGSAFEALSPPLVSALSAPDAELGLGNRLASEMVSLLVLLRGPAAAGGPVQAISWSMERMT